MPGAAIIERLVYGRRDELDGKMRWDRSLKTGIITDREYGVMPPAALNTYWYLGVARVSESR